MTAKTHWFQCGKCGFMNHPRVYRGSISGVAIPENKPDGTHNELCEQCGAHNSHEQARDYNP